MKLFAIIAAVSASQVIPRRLNCEKAEFIDEAPSDYTNVGVRFVNINDDKYNAELFNFNQVDRIGGKGFLVAGTDDPSQWTGGHTK